MVPYLSLYILHYILIPTLNHLCIFYQLIFVDDACDALIVCAESNKTDGQIVNIGTGKGITFLELADEIKNITNGQVKIIDYTKDIKQIEPGDFVADIAKMKKLIGRQPKTGLKEGIKKTVDFYKENRENYW